MPTPYLVPAIKRAFEIIDLLSEADGGLRVSDIHRTLHLPLSSAATILYTLESLGYVERTGADSRYKLGVKLLGFSRKLSQLDLVGQCHPLLEELVAEAGMTAHLAVMRETLSIYVDRVPAPGLIQVSSYVGMSWPLQTSAVGKAILTFLTESELKEKLASIEFQRMTAETIASRSALERQLAVFRPLGYAWEIGEGEEGVACIAAPVFGPTGRVVAATSITGTIHQINKTRIAPLGKLIKKYAARMSEGLHSDRA